MIDDPPTSMMTFVSDRRTISLVVLLLILVVSIARLLRASSRAQTQSPRGAGAAGLAAVGGVWMLVNEPVEGPILFIVSPGHGITLADIPSVALFAVALALLRSRRRRR